MYEKTIAGLRKIVHDYKGRLTPYMRLTICEATDAIEELSRAQVLWIEQERKALLKSLPRWIPMMERLPDKSGNYLTAFDDGTAMAVNEFMHPRDWLTEEGREANPNGKWYWGGVTHWMPLPEPPKEDA